MDCGSAAGVTDRDQAKSPYRRTALLEFRFGGTLGGKQTATC